MSVTEKIPQAEWVKQLQNVPSLDSDSVDIISKILERYLSPEEMDKYMNLNSLQLNGLYAALEYNSKPENADKYQIDIDKLCTSGLNSTQMQILVIAANNYVDPEIIEEYYDASIPYSISNYILKAVIEYGAGKEINKYLRGYTVGQVYEICSGIAEGVDISTYDNPDYDESLMRLIRAANIANYRYIPETDTFENNKKE